ncbi:MAG: penicillin acylase family protein, partial [Myxococcota bacterium]
RLDLAASGAVVWREFLGEFNEAERRDAGPLLSDPFDPDDPVATPRNLTVAADIDDDPVLQALAGAVVRLGQAGLDLDTSLGQTQFTRRANDRSGASSDTIPIHGGLTLEGALNIVGFGLASKTTLAPGIERAAVVNPATGLTEEGYVINRGTSFLMAMEFSASGPEGFAFVTYGQSDDPESPYHSDQTRAFSDKEWRQILWTEEAIAGDPDLVVEDIEGFTDTE